MSMANNANKMIVIAGSNSLNDLLADITPPMHVRESLDTYQDMMIDMDDCDQTIIERQSNVPGNANKYRAMTTKAAYDPMNRSSFSRNINPSSIVANARKELATL